MPAKASRFALLFAAVSALALIAVAPRAAADEPNPPVGQSPVEAIHYLKGEGYNVAINWTTGYPDVPLDECTLVAIHNPDGAGPKQNTTVYLDISCPADNTDSD
jgi:hypothetical protein